MQLDLAQQKAQEMANRYLVNLKSVKHLKKMNYLIIIIKNLKKVEKVKKINKLILIL